MAKIPYIKHAIKHIFMPAETERRHYKLVDAPESYRGRIKFDENTCIGCGMCMRVCAPEAITKKVEKLDGEEKITMNFDLGSCTFCKMCEDFCPKKSIKLTKDYALVSSDKSSFHEKGSFIKKLPVKTDKKPAEKPMEDKG
ncbi:4Fe-4S binding protein [Clostridium lundense]|uniref:4Fe-4S binding protein n=1 Tax=Clostridium lundense TaxID=319475 RepID=UPI000683DD88|nr:4Fe-4S binding protein [Clostridium lundense]